MEREWSCLNCLTSWSITLSGCWPHDSLPSFFALGPLFPHFSLSVFDFSQFTLNLPSGEVQLLRLPLFSKRQAGFVCLVIVWVAPWHRVLAFLLGSTRADRRSRNLGVARPVWKATSSDPGRPRPGAEEKPLRLFLFSLCLPFPSHAFVRPPLPARHGPATTPAAAQFSSLLEKHGLDSRPKPEH